MRHLGGRILAAAVAATLAAPVGWGQQGLKIQVVAGEDAINNIDRGIGVEPIVEVQDSAGAPIPNAKVTFRAPASGPSVTFYGASPTTSLTTDEAGRAQAIGMVPNTEAGTFRIAVEAEHQGETATAAITQSNVRAPAFEPEEKKRGWGWKIVTLIGVGVAGGIAAAALSGDGDSVPTPTSVGVGGVTVGAPR